jgi:ParB/RepB/Spo0J family partition protein
MSTTLTSKPLDWFKPDPGNPRQSSAIEELRQLRDSLFKKQLVPLLAKPDGTIIDGHRRWFAAKLDGRPESLEVIITEEPLTPAQVKEIQLVSALHRADLKPYEQYVGCRDYLALTPGVTFRDLAVRLDRDPSMIGRILSLGKCIPPVQQAAADGKLGPSEWYAIAKLSTEAEQQAMLEAKLAGASRDQLEQKGRKLRNGQAQGVRVNRLRIPLGPQGRSVTIAGRSLTLTDVQELLNEASKSVRKADGEGLDVKTYGQVMKQKAKAAS